MIVETFRYDSSEQQWSIRKFPKLDSERSLVMAFGTPHLQSKPNVFKSLTNAFPNSHLIGCSTAGEVLNGELYDGSLSVAVMKFAHATLRHASTVIRQFDRLENVGLDLASQLKHPTLAGVILFCDGIDVDHSALMGALQSELQVPIIGAGAADGRRFQQAWVWVDDRLQSGLCAAVGLYGPEVNLYSAVTQPWGSYGHCVATRTERNVVFELDTKPALDVCRIGAGLRPVRFVDGPQQGKVLSALSIDKEAGSVVFTDPVPEGARLELLGSDVGQVLREVETVAAKVRPMTTARSESGASSIALAVSSVNRRIFLASKAKAEIKAATSGLDETPSIGLYAYGDLSSNGTSPGTQRSTALMVTVISETIGETTSMGPNMPSATGERILATGPSLADVRPRQVQVGDISAETYDLGRMSFIVLKGDLNEQFSGEQIYSNFRGDVVLDLGGIKMVTSFGVRGWLELMNAAKQQVDSLYFANCSEEIINQMSMVHNFSGGAIVVSFAAPYICTSCSNMFQVTIDCERSKEDIRSGNSPDLACSDCGNRAVFDDDPDAYFQFVINDLDHEIPAAVRKALRERDQLESISVVDSIEKKVDGRRTILRVKRKLDEKVRWKRVLSGLEGILQVDFSGCKGATEVGVDRFLSALGLLDEAVSDIVLDQVSLEIMSQLVRSEPQEKVSVRTLLLSARCSSCGVARNAGINAMAVRQAAERGSSPTTECPRCNTTMDVSLPPDVLAFMGAQSSAKAPSTKILLIAGVVLSVLLIALILWKLL